MRTARRQICEHDVVRLRQPMGALIEIADDQGVMLDLISAIDSALDLVWSGRPVQSPE